MQGRPWTEQDTAFFNSRTMNSICLMFERADARTVAFSLDFLPDISGSESRLRGLEVYGPLTDDSPALDQRQLESLVLMTASRQPLQLAGMANLWSLVVRDRPGLAGELPRLTGLTELGLIRYRCDSLRCLGALPQLRSLRVEASRTMLSLEGIEGCPNLRELMVLDATVTSLRPLAGLTDLRHVHLSGVKNRPGPPLDLADLAVLRELRSCACRRRDRSGRFDRCSICRHSIRSARTTTCSTGICHLWSRSGPAFGREAAAPR